MSVLFFMGMAVICFGLASRFYSRYLSRSLGEDSCRETPAKSINDGRDYVPTKPYVLFAHHFSAIAGAGPIVGPTVAILYGYVPTWLWVVLGGIFIGAVHDYLALFICMREGGKSMAEVARKTLGSTAFVLFILFTIMMIVLVTSAFLSMVAVSLTSLWPLAKLGLSEGQTLLKTTVINGEVYGRIGGIASMSVVIITAFSPLLGWLIYKKNLPGMLSYPLAAFLCISSIVAGIYYPIILSSNVWTVIISIYVFFAAGVPVWVILQPRDFINVQILYAGIVLMLVSLLVVGFQGIEFSLPASNIKEGIDKLGLVWPMMFIMIACGAISGFHSLVAGGTTSKQLANECDARRIGFNAMLLESVLAVCVIMAMAIGINFADYKTIVYPAVEGVKSNPVLAFSLATGKVVSEALKIPMDLAVVFGILMVEGFVITSLDAAVRFNRYLFEELWAIIFENPPALLKNYWFNSGLSVLLMWILAYTNAFNSLWPIFGASNQLLAGLALITTTAWLLSRGKKFIFALLPAIFMMLTTLTALFILMKKYWLSANYLLLGADLFLMVLAFGVIILLINRLSRRMKSNQIASDSR